MIYTVTFNPSLDYTLSVDTLSADDINRAQTEELNVGGKGINVSVILSRLSVENRALGFLAGFSGMQIENMLAAEGIDTDFVYLDAGYTRINVKLKAEKELDINANGPNITEKALEMLLSKLDALGSGDYLVLAGSVPASVSDDVYEVIMQRLSKRNIKFVVDAQKNLLKNVLKYKPFLIKPNHLELGEFFSVEIDSVEKAVYYAQKLQKMGAENVIVSMAKNGAILVDDAGNVYSADIVQGKTVSSAGCGDSMVAGFIAGYSQGESCSKAFELGAACANATAFFAGLAEKEDIDLILSEKKITVKKNIGG